MMLGLPWWLSSKESTSNAGDTRDPWVWKIPRKRRWQPSRGFLLGKSHGWKNLVGYRPSCGLGLQRVGLTEQLSTNIQWCLSFRGWLANWCWLLSGDLESSLLGVTILTAWQLAPSKVNNPKEQGRDFTGGPGVKNLPAKAADMGLILGLRTKILPASGQLSPCTTPVEPLHSGARAPQLLNPWAQLLKPIA